ncbi:hypothetical protein BJX99DRAFT_54059 [Aspergillus californicus]
MSGVLGDEEDSRIASVGIQRNRKSASTSNNSSRHASREPPNKRQRRTRNTLNPDVQDFVPKGASFSANTLAVDPDSTSASGSDSESEDSFLSSSRSGSGSESDSDSGSGNDRVNKTSTEPTVGSAPAPNWNKTGKGVIRTSLRSRPKQNNASESAAAKNFDSVNGTYWQSGSASDSEGEKEGKDGAALVSDGSNTHAEGEIKQDQGSVHSSPSSEDSDGSESLDSEADDSIMLNLGSRGQSREQNDILRISDEDDYDPEALSVAQSPAEDNMFDSLNGELNGFTTDSKEGALSRFAQKYRTAPAKLADLDREDMDMQAKSFYYGQNINGIDLQLPVMCLECLREGHMAEVCPLKECTHCGAWNRHQSALCPQWRRCQRCRERGHDQKQCLSALKGSATENPCDLCGATEHLELDCDFLWKFPRQEPTAAPVIVSLSCAHCTSNHHLIGDCPSLPRPFPSSTFTTRGLDADIIMNTNSIVNTKRSGAPPPPPGGQRGMKIRGRADQARSLSPDSDDMMSMSMNMSRGGRMGGPAGGNRNGNRGNINIRIGGNHKNSGPPPPPARDYRDREDPYPRNNRQRSMSPGRDRRPSRGRGGWQAGPPRSPPRGQGRPPKGGGGRGGGRGGKRGGGNGDTYRPMPSAAKKAWDQYRL